MLTSITPAHPHRRNGVLHPSRQPQRIVARTVAARADPGRHLACWICAKTVAQRRSSVCRPLFWPLRLFVCLLRDPGSRISLILANSVCLFVDVDFGQPASSDGWSDLDEILQDGLDMARKSCFLSWTWLAYPLLWQPWKTLIFCDSDHFERHFLRK